MHGNMNVKTALMLVRRAIHTPGCLLYDGKSRMSLPTEDVEGLSVANRKRSTLAAVCHVLYRSSRDITSLKI